MAILYTLIFHLVVLIILVLIKVEGLKQEQELGIELEFEERTLEEILAEEVGEKLDLEIKTLSFFLMRTSSIKA